VLVWLLAFFVIAVIVAVLCVGGIAGLSADIGWLFALLAVVLLVVTMLIARGGPPRLL
jgi:uncharacterized membrane protein YtjA (UPF0391 family)